MEKNGQNPDKLDEPASGYDKMNEMEQNDSLPEELVSGGIIRQSTSRRDFLKVLGFSFASAAVLASCKRPVQQALPYIIQPPEVTPGKSLY
jgi:molybdopterin-containing oxidoreductase family iron-sulfur binding subunit